MKKYTYLLKETIGLFAWSLFFYMATSALTAAGQQIMQQDQPHTAIKENNLKDDEKLIRQEMKEDGMSDAVIDKLMEQRKNISHSDRILTWTQVKGSSNNISTAFGTCDMGGENGWDVWKAATGTYGPPATSPPLFAAAGPPASPRFNLTNGAGIDPCTPGINAGDPAIPVVAPGFGNASIQIGEPMMAGALAEQLTYPLTVTAQDTNFTYAYAIVMQNAGHPTTDQPFVSIGIYDQTGATIPGGYFMYVAGAGIPGSYTASCSFGAFYIPWTLVSIDLSPYVGQTLNVVITNVDCRQGGHWAHSYWDFSCVPITTSITEDNTSELNLSVFPNPFENYATMIYTLNEKSEVTLEVYNILGKKVNTIVDNETQNKGNYQYILGSETNAGIYLVKLIAGDKVYTQQLIQFNNRHW